tara:strand:- start:2886 stop:3677 length:792 start_codon:yes stop_codon:yes gene_type:complete
MDYLNLEQIQESCPSVFTKKPSKHLSHIYKHIPTTRIIDILEEKNWGVTQALQTGTRTGYENTIPYKKHIIRFRNKEMDNLSAEIGDTHPEIVLTNSHNGTSSFKFHVGLFRLVCSNGLVVADKTFDQYSIRHKGFKKSSILETVGQITTHIPQVVGKVQGMMGVELTPQQRRDFAQQAVIERWGKDRHVNLDELLTINRAADKGNDLWTVFNRIQEGMIRGGLNTYVKKDGKIKYNKTRAVKSIDENLKVNKMLWSLSEAMM